MTKFKIKSTMKENWRYIAFHLLSKTPAHEQDVVKAVTSSILRMFGEIGASETNVWLIEFDEKTQSGILRCSHTAVQTVVASITTVNKVNEQDAAFIVKGVSGTINKVKGKYLK